MDALRLKESIHHEVDRPKNKLGLKGKFHLEVWRKGQMVEKVDFDNGIVNEGLTHLLEVGFHNGAQTNPWYIGLISNSGFSSLNNADTMNSHAGWLESSAYDEPNRPQWTAGTAANRSITNASTVDFTIDATVTIRGIFITSNNVKGGSTGILWSTGVFGSTVALQDDDVLKITYSLSG